MILLSSPPLECCMLTMTSWHWLNLRFPSRLQSLKLSSHWLEAPSVCCLTLCILMWHLLSSCSSYYRRSARVFRVSQMLLNLKLSQARAISHLTNIEVKTLGNLVLAKRYSFLAPSEVAGDQQLKNLMCMTSTTNSLLFVGQLMPVVKELSECKRHQLVPSNRRSSTCQATRLAPTFLILCLPLDNTWEALRSPGRRRTC